MKQERAARRAEGKVRERLRRTLLQLRSTKNLAEMRLLALQQKQSEMVALRRENKRLKGLVANAAGQLFLERLEAAHA